MTSESKRDWENFFRPEDLCDTELILSMVFGYAGQTWDLMAEKANEIIRKELEKGLTVYSYKPKGKWGSWTQGAAEEGEYTHTAKLICIQEIKK